MHHDYRDIIDEMTDTLRELHTWIKQDGDGPSPSCADQIDPKTDECRCVARPQWWDENGTPRFRQHHPDLCADIYANEVALLKIACQSCGREFLVQMSSSPYQRVRDTAMAGTHGVIPRLLDETLAMLKVALGVGPNPMLNHMEAIAIEFDEHRKRRTLTLADEVAANTIHYGDPPNVGCCRAGSVMSCDDIAVIEFWRRGRTPAGPGPIAIGDAADSMGWSRVPELERDITGITW